MILSFYLLKNKLKWTFSFLYLYAVILTDSRIGLVTYLILLFYFILNNFNKESKIVSFLPLIVVIPLIAIFLLSQSERGHGVLELKKNISFAFSAYRKIDTEKFSISMANSLNQNSIRYYGEPGDLSTSQRVIKWIFVLKNTFSSLKNLIIGASPGYYGMAVDGSYIRIIGELGLIGLLCYVALFYNIYNIHDLIKPIVFAILFNAIFIDVLFSSRAITVILALAGSFININERK